MTFYPETTPDATPDPSAPFEVLRQAIAPFCAVPDTPNRWDLVNRLLALPGEIEIAEHDLLAMQMTLTAERSHLARTHAELVLSGKIEGKNAAERDAQLLLATINQQGHCQALELEVTRMRIGRDALLNELSALRAVTLLWKDGDA